MIEIARVDQKIGALAAIDNEINRQELVLYSRKRAIRSQLRDLRKRRHQMIATLARSVGHPRTIPIAKRRKQVALIKKMRSAGMSWRTVGLALGYRHHSEPIRILRVYGNV